MSYGEDHREVQDHAGDLQGELDTLGILQLGGHLAPEKIKIRMMDQTKFGSSLAQLSKQGSRPC